MLSRDPQAQADGIVFIKLAEQGSTVLAFEAIRAAVRRVGAENVYFMVFEENRFVLDLLELIPPENVLTVRTRSPWSMVWSALCRLREMRRKRLLACIDMEFFSRFSAVLAYLSGARQRVGLHSYYGEGGYRGNLMTHRVLYNPHIHTSRTFLGLVEALDIAPEQLPTFPSVPASPCPLPLFQPAAAERDETRQLIADLGVTPDRKLILLNANASDLLPIRKWDPQNYLELARRLLAEFDDLTIGFTGAPDEAEEIGQLVTSLSTPACVSLAGKTTMRQLLIVYGMAEVLVTNDSGPAHFAALTTIDTVVLFGPETPLLFSALTPRTHPLWTGLTCSPCVNAYNSRQTACRDNRCMKTITVEQVFEKVCAIYRRRGNKSETPERDISGRAPCWRISAD